MRSEATSIIATFTQQCHYRLPHLTFPLPPTPTLRYISNLLHITTILTHLPNSIKLVLSDPQLDCVISLAFALADQEMIKLEGFLQEGIKSKGGNFCFYLVQFLGGEYMRAKPSDAPLTVTSLENITTCLKCLSQTDKSVLSLRNNNNVELGEAVKQLGGTISAKFPSVEVGERANEEIEEMADGYVKSEMSERTP